MSYRYSLRQWAGHAVACDQLYEAARAALAEMRAVHRCQDCCGQCPLGRAIRLTEEAIAAAEDAPTDRAGG